MMGFQNSTTFIITKGDNGHVCEEPIPDPAHVPRDPTLPCLTIEDLLAATDCCAENIRIMTPVQMEICTSETCMQTPVGEGIVCLDPGYLD